MKITPNIFQCLILGLAFWSCSNSESQAELKSCKSFFEERFFQINVAYMKFSRKGIFDIDLNNLFKESKKYLDAERYSKIDSLLSIYLDSVQAIQQTSSIELDSLVQKTESLVQGSCSYYFNLIQTFETFYKQTSSFEGLYMPEITIKLFVDNNLRLKRDTVYKFEYGLISNTYPNDINNVYFDTEILEVSTYGDSAVIQKSLKFDLINNFTNEKHTYIEEFLFKIED